MYDGFGFPIDLTSMIADEHGVKIDMVGFERTRKRTHKVFMPLLVMFLCLARDDTCFFSHTLSVSKILYC